MTIDIVDDSTSEPSNECFTLELSDGTETIDNPSATTVCITDDDGQLRTVWVLLYVKWREDTMIFDSYSHRKL